MGGTAAQEVKDKSHLQGQAPEVVDGSGEGGAAHPFTTDRGPEPLDLFMHAFRLKILDLFISDVEQQRSRGNK